LVPQLNIIARVLNFSLMILMPVGLALYLSRKLKTEWKLFGIGVLTFVISQVFHIPFNGLVLNPLVNKLGLSLTQNGFQLAMVGLIYGLSAGVFEEITRFLGYRWWIKDERDWKSALMVGAGHGGIESILLGGVVLLAFIQATTLQGTDLSTVVDADQVEMVRAQIEAYWAAPWQLALLGAVERLATICFHLSATVLVLQSFHRKNGIWVILAVCWHTLVDATAVFASRTWNPYITEGLILGLGMVSLVIVYVLKSPDEPRVNGIPTAPNGYTAPEIKAITPSETDLEDSRYV
jgi:uncharacterized membrane protein YhfC